MPRRGLPFAGRARKAYLGYRTLSGLTKLSHPAYECLSPP
jgi:hypothetical protein